ncbi:MAG: hypothetical protein M1831_004212 [Alyxoria varia]|nr:MAG: hypothetical protein M1831_004212 [Alyxoria varia]
MSKSTTAWDRVNERFYRKFQLYSDVFDEDLDLSSYLISGAPYSGALALHRHADQFCSGKLIRSLNWDQRPIRGLGWSEDEKLLVIAQDGTVRIYSDLSNDYSPFTLGNHVTSQDVEEHGVVACKFWLSGFVALLGNNRLIAVGRYDEPRPKLLATPPSDAVVSWAIIPPAYSLSGSVEALLAIGQTINVVDADTCEDRMLQNGPFRHMSVSPNGRFIALYTDDGKVWVITSDFQDKLSEYDTRARTVPKDMQWCGNDAVALAWEDEVQLVGPQGSGSRYYFDGWVHLVPDVDGIRLFTNESCEFLQRVPDVIEDIFKLSSTSPAAVLLDALHQMDNRSPKAHENLQLIKDRLPEAIDSCIAAAGHEYDADTQRQLLKAASFGKTSLDIYDSDAFVDMCETVRTLNAVRFYEIGLPLSFDQYERLNPERLVQRLVNRREYFLALRLADYLRLPNDGMYVHWACQKVRTSTDSEESICRQIVAKLRSRRPNGGGVSYEQIARAAHDEGRRDLATSLLEHEPLAGKQVLLLLDMEEDVLALDKSIDSGDTDLTLYVLLQMRRKMPLATFFRTVNSRPVAVALVESTARGGDTDLLKDLYYQDDRRVDGANLLFREALATRDDEAQARSDKSRSAVRLLKDSKEYAPHTRLIEDAERLRHVQENLDADPKLFLSSSSADSSVDSSTTGGTAASRPRLTGLSLNRTLLTLLQHPAPAPSTAEKLASDFSVSARTLWHLRLRALITTRNWREAETLAKNHGSSKKTAPPFGWSVFAKEILNAGNARLAGNMFVPLCKELEWRDKAELYEKCGFWGRAAEEGAKVGKDAQYVRGLVERMPREAQTGRERVEVEKWLGVVEGKGKRGR